MTFCKITGIEFEDGLKKDVNEKAKLNIEDYLSMDSNGKYFIMNDSIKEDIKEWLSNKYGENVTDYSYVREVC